jgi:hypothetical protein
MTETISTRQRIKLAFTKLKRDAGAQGKQPTINAVARAAGVSHTLIHTKFPDIADGIRENNGQAPKQKVAKHRLDLEAASTRSAELRNELRDVKLINRGLAGQNATLTLLVKRLETEVAALEAGAIPLRPQTKKRSR